MKSASKTVFFETEPSAIIVSNSFATRMQFGSDMSTFTFLPLLTVLAGHWLAQK